MSMSVLQGGVQSTVQDLGRNGYAHYGISASGAADAVSLRIGNLLVGNPEDYSGLEMTLTGGEYQFNKEAFIALSGSEFHANLDGETFPFQQGAYIRKGQILHIGGTKKGARCYLCVRGGFDIPKYLSGVTTHIMSGLGGFKGRSIEKGDARSSFLSQSYTVSEKSSRMGVQLKGNSIQSIKENEILTEGIPLGAIQVPGGGDPIISFVEHQTTGGYPKIANVITADLCKVGQLKPGDSFTFQLVSIEEGERLRLAQESFIQSLKNHD